MELGPKENAEVVGTDEAFFEDEGERQELVDLYNENAGILDGEADTEVDLASYAYQPKFGARSSRAAGGMPRSVRNWQRVRFAI